MPQENDRSIEAMAAQLEELDNQTGDSVRKMVVTTLGNEVVESRVALLVKCIKHWRHLAAKIKKLNKPDHKYYTLSDQGAFAPHEVYTAGLAESIIELQEKSKKLTEAINGAIKENPSAGDYDNLDKVFGERCSCKGKH